jgi:hypothetical protein
MADLGPEDRSAISGVGHYGPITSKTVAGMADLSRWRDSSARAVWGGYSFGHGTVVMPSGRFDSANGPFRPVPGLSAVELCPKLTPYWLSPTSCCAMRDFIIVAVLCLLAAIVADYVWLGGQYSTKVMYELGLDIRSINRR